MDLAPENIEECKGSSNDRNGTRITARKVYKEKCPFRIIKVETNYRMIKSSFDSWLSGSNEEDFDRLIYL